MVIFFLRLKIFPSFNFWILPDQEVLASPCFTLGKEIDGIRNLAAVNAVDALSYWKSPTNPNFVSLEILSICMIFEFKFFALSSKVESKYKEKFFSIAQKKKVKVLIIEKLRIQSLIEPEVKL